MQQKEPVAQRQEMVIGILALLWYFVMVAVMGAGQRLWREPEETKSCRIQGESVRPSIRTYVRLSLPPEALQRLTQATQRLTQASLKLAQAFQMNDQMDGRDVQIPPVFYRTLSPSGPLPCSL